MNNEDTNTLVFSVDDNYAIYLAVAIKSILCNKKTNNKIEIIIFDFSISSESKKKILELQQENITISFREVDENLFDDFPLTISYITVASYLRLKLPSLLPSHNKILYLDVDLLVFGDIDELFALHMNGKALLGVVDPLLNSNAQHKQEIGLDSKNYYLNAGVLLIDLNKLRELDFESSVMKYLSNYKDLIKYQDQDIINAVVANEAGIINPKFNYMPAFRRILRNKNTSENYPFTINEIKESKRQVVISHYCGPEKPWMYACRHVGCLQFKHFLNQTPWRGAEYTDLKNISLYKKCEYFFKRLSRN